MLTYLVCPSVQFFFHTFKEIRTCFKFWAKQLLVLRAPDWQILAQQVLKTRLLEAGFYRSLHCFVWIEYMYLLLNTFK